MKLHHLDMVAVDSHRFNINCFRQYGRVSKHNLGEVSYAKGYSERIKYQFPTCLADLHRQCFTGTYSLKVSTNEQILVALLLQPF